MGIISKGQKRGRPFSLTGLRIGLAFFLLLVSAAIIYTTAQNYSSAQSLAIQALESTALALSSSAESALRASGSPISMEMRQILSDRVVAYALIAGKNGQVLFHTNPRLVGSYLSDEELQQKWPARTASGRRITLLTGLPAYQFNYILHRPDGTAELLRLVLHTTPADRIISEARRMWWTVGAVLVLLWTVGVLLERVLTHHLRLKEEAERRKQLALIGQMTAVLAHEIRNALGSMKGYVQWVDEKLEVEDIRKPGLMAVLQGVERIESLVNELLFFSREETFHLERFEIAPLLQEAIQAAPPWRGTVELASAPDLRAMADREKLRRVLINGIRNSIQSMGEKGILKITAHPDGPWVQIHIEDTGAGIPAAEIPLLFTPFHTTKTDGTGLGLAYSKKVLEGMGGKIKLANRERGAGSLLTIHLPHTGEK